MASTLHKLFIEYLIHSSLQKYQMIENANYISWKSKVIKFLKDIDLFNMLMAIISYILWQVSMTTQPNPMHIPPMDASVNYPLSTSKVSKTFLDNLIFFGSISTILILYLLSLYFPKHFKKFYLFSSIWSLIMANCFSLAIASYFKSYVGWPRPDTYAVCGYNTTYETCKSSKKDKQFLSWPSYHAAQAMAGATYLSFFIQKVLPKCVLFDMIGLSMIFSAIYVGATRIRDFKHHPDDVTAGILVGFVVSFFMWNGAKKRIFVKKEKKKL
ncbi:PAP2 superfamily protein [Tritrichomonas foetus]|uniref:PAP2 superfamily protein n=1 Tax=Tritrichomonas foetus TaxID=1144522 RepID=A0A1J4JGU7_9EUKA|nr:PAP2 superfamily protein [Tritrichomonas foetus]|eukprot:OHS98378.1 PAP2 superfamily protein [Tritrichomonas foetus]